MAAKKVEKILLITIKRWIIVINRKKIRGMMGKTSEFLVLLIIN
jgi:hypothetical protein